MSAPIIKTQGLQFTLASSEAFKSLCQPIIERLDLNYVRHIRLYNDMSQFTLCTRPEMIEWYFENELYNLGYSEKHPSTYKKGIILSDSWEKEGDPYEKLGKPFEEDFNVAHSLCVNETHEDYCDIFEFGAPKKNPRVVLDFMANLPCIHKFTKSVLMSSELAKQGENNTFHLSYNDDVNLFHNMHHNKIISCEFNNGRPLNPLLKLSKREIETLYWLKLGKTIPEVALILELSKRTIELYVKNLKEKLQAYNLFQVGETVGRYHHHFRALFAALQHDSMS